MGACGRKSKKGENKTAPLCLCFAVIKGTSSFVPFFFNKDCSDIQGVFQKLFLF